MQNSQTRKGPGYRALAALLAEYINQSSTPFLPSSREIRARFNVSLRTAGRAVLMLRQRGLVEVMRGKRVRILKKDGVLLSPESEGLREGAKAAVILKNRIKEDIASGIYQSGDVMPKFARFAIGMHMSTATICAAFGMLKDENLVHKAGRRWIVGPGAPAGDERRKRPLSHRDRAMLPVILVFVNEIADWDNHLSKDRLAPYLLTLLTEMEKHDFVLQLAQQRDRGAIAARRYPSGRRNILDFIRQLGKRYAGTLAHFLSKDSADTQEWFSRLCGFKKPVVVSDIANQQPLFDRRLVNMPGYYRCFADERKAVDTAIESLCQAGHRIIGIPRAVRPGGQPLWYPQRLDFILASAAATQPPLTVHIQDVEPNPWDDFEPVKDREQSGEPSIMDRIEAIREKVKSECPPSLSHDEINLRLQEKLIEMAPALMRLISQPGLTAILGPNQTIGVNCWHWLTSAGISIPRDLSLVMIDTLPRLHHLPITTVDFGFEVLGYKTAHVFIGDVPIKADRWGNIGSEPHLRDRGTVAAPSKNGAIFLPHMAGRK